MIAFAACMAVLTAGTLFGIVGLVLAVDARPHRRGYVGRHRAMP